MLLGAVAGFVLVLAAGVAAAALRVDDVRAAAADAQRSAERAITELRDGDFRGAEVTLALAVEQLDAVRRELAHPSLALARITPFVGAEIAATRDLVAAAADVAAELNDLAVELEPVLGGDRPKLLTGKGRIDLASLDVLRAALVAHRGDIDAAIDRATSSFDRLRFGLARDAAGSVVSQLGRVQDSFGDAEHLLDLLPGLLGAEQPRSLLIVLQNLAESRGTGGLIGGYALLRADAGRLQLSRVDSNVTLKLPIDAEPVPMPGWFSRRYDRYLSRSHWSNVNMHADVPTTAPLLAQLFEDTAGTRVDAVIFMDPVTLEALVNATGPVSAGGVTFAPNETARFILADSYRRFGVTDYETAGVEGGTERKSMMVTLAERLIPRVLHPAHVINVTGALAGTAGQGHLAIWSSDTGEQASLRALALDGSVIGDEGSWIGLGINNGAANKMDAYLHRSVQVRTLEDGSLTASIGFALEVADLYELPQFVAGPIPDTDDLVIGQTRLLTEIYLPPGAVLSERPEGAQVSDIPGAVLVDVLVDVFPDRPAQLQLTYTLPGDAATAPVVVRAGPGAFPLELSGAISP